MIKVRVGWCEERRRWQVREMHPNGKSEHHSYHRTQAAARTTARAQAKQNRKDAEKAR